MAASTRVMFLCLFVLSLGACATTFKGDAQFPGGPRGCYDRCEKAGLTMTSYVFVGEYSSGCVCSLKRKPTSASDGASAQSSAATSAAAVAVMRQMQEEQARHQALFSPQPNAAMY